MTAYFLDQKFTARSREDAWAWIERVARLRGFKSADEAVMSGFAYH